MHLMPTTLASAVLQLVLCSPIAVVQLFTDPRRKVSQHSALQRQNSLYLRSTLDKLGFGCTKRTKIYEDNASIIMIVNYQVPTEHARHIYVQYFAIQDWKEWGCIQLIHIPSVINPADDLTKPLGWVLLHSRHCRQFMRHYA